MKRKDLLNVNRVDGESIKNSHLQFGVSYFLPRSGREMVEV